MESDGILQEFFSLTDGGWTQFTVYALGTIKQSLEFRQGFLGRSEGLLGVASELLVREVAGEGGASLADAETPAYKCCGFVGEPGQVFL